MRVSTRCSRAERDQRHQRGRAPPTIAVVKSASAGGGLMRRPRLYQIAADWKTKLELSVAMIGGMRSKRISA